MPVELNDCLSFEALERAFVKSEGESGSMRGYYMVTADTSVPVRCALAHKQLGGGWCGAEPKKHQPCCQSFVFHIAAKRLLYEQDNTVW
jgi:hypothetical protein